MNSDLGDVFETTILDSTGATSFEVEAVIQELWSGYGEILKIRLQGGERDTVVVKHVTLPERDCHPRGWNSDLSHQRKVFSYQVETEWYQSYSGRCDERCRIPEFLSFARDEGRVLLILEDLDSSGYPRRFTSLQWPQIESCLRWLAEFHAAFLNESVQGLWETGTYWHLETRPEELAALDDEVLREAAIPIDRKLREARFQSVVHGDAKLANFCFSEDGTRVAALDFQYIGRGCGMKDVAYFIGSCLDENSCEAREDELLESYFGSLGDALARRKPGIDTEALEREWRSLFPLAWTDFHRFLKGWCPGHWKLNSYSERIARSVIESLKNET